jgi:hypothetical protein
VGPCGAAAHRRRRSSSPVVTAFPWRWSGGGAQAGPRVPKELLGSARGSPERRGHGSRQPDVAVPAATLFRRLGKAKKQRCVLSTAWQRWRRAQLGRWLSAGAETRQWQSLASRPWRTRPRAARASAQERGRVRPRAWGASQASSNPIGSSRGVRRGGGHGVGHGRHVQDARHPLRHYVGHLAGSERDKVGHCFGLAPGRF